MCVLFLFCFKSIYNLLTRAQGGGVLWVWVGGCICVRVYYTRMCSRTCVCARRCLRAQWCTHMHTRVCLCARVYARARIVARVCARVFGRFTRILARFRACVCYFFVCLCLLYIFCFVYTRACVA